VTTIARCALRGAVLSVASVERTAEVDHAELDAIRASYVASLIDCR